MKIGKNFVNLESYNANMTKGMEDKLFFLDHLDSNKKYTFVDFGCADGSLIDILYHIRPKDKYIGYDISEQMIDLARTKISESPENVIFTSNWNEVKHKLLKNSNVKVLILSSVVHEVFSYAKDIKDIFEFWSKVLNTGFDYICVRDMMVPKDIIETPAPGYMIENIQSGYGKFMNNERFREFEKIWGPIKINETTKQEVFHFLLKYRWQINWNREVHENYFPISIEDFLSMFKERYNLYYFERFCVPFIKDKIKEDFYLVLDDKDSTHIKAIFSRKTN